MIPVAKFVPDQAPLSGGAYLHNNVYAGTPTAFCPIGSPLSIGNALDDGCKGAVSYRGSDGIVGTFAATATKIYQWDGSAWNDVSKVGGYTTPDENMWDFSQQGNFVLATNGADPVQYFELGTSTAFDDLAGSPPVSLICETVRDFSFLGATANGQNYVQWSAINDPEVWTITPSTTQGDEQAIPTGGRLINIVGGEYAIVFMETAIHRFTYTGDINSIFQRDEISRERGCVSKGSIATYQDKIFFLSYDGFYVLQGGANPIPIGDQKIDRYFWNLVDQSKLHQMSAVTDPIRKLYIIAFTSLNSLDGKNDTMLWYNWTIGEWSPVIQRADILASLLIDVGYNGDNFPDATDSASPDDPGVLSPDSSLLTGAPKGKLSLFGSDFKVAFFEGPNLEAKIPTVEGQISPGATTFVTQIWPLVDGGTPSIQIGARNRLIDSVVWSGASTINQTGFCPVRVKARYHQALITIPSGDSWNFVEGIDNTQTTRTGFR